MTSLLYIILHIMRLISKEIYDLILIEPQNILSLVSYDIKYRP